MKRIIIGTIIPFLMALLILAGCSHALVSHKVVDGPAIQEEKRVTEGSRRIIARVTRRNGELVGVAMEEPDSSQGLGHQRDLDNQGR